MCGTEGGTNRKLIPLGVRESLIALKSIVTIAWRISFGDPLRLVTLSQNMTWGCPFRADIQSITCMVESLFKRCAISRWIALSVKHVNSTPHLLSRCLSFLTIISPQTVDPLKVVMLGFYRFSTSSIWRILISLQSDSLSPNISV